MLINVCPAKYQAVVEAAIKRALRDLPTTPDFGVDEWRTGELVIVVAQVPADASNRMARLAGELLTESPV